MSEPPNLRAVKIPDCCDFCKHYELENYCKKYNTGIPSYHICDSYNTEGDKKQ